MPRPWPDPQAISSTSLPRAMSAATEYRVYIIDAPSRDSGMPVVSVRSSKRGAGVAKTCACRWSELVARRAAVGEDGRRDDEGGAKHDARVAPQVPVADVVELDRAPLGIADVVAAADRPRARQAGTYGEKEITGVSILG